MSNALRADDRQLILDALNRQHDDLRRKAGGRQLPGERYASLRRYHRERADRSPQLAAELAQVPCGDYVLISGRTRADAERDRAAGSRALGQLYDSGPEAGQ
ncbi:MAG: hypothetical protein ACLQDY_14375 [Streptosporangiaceae bacterium]